MSDQRIRELVQELSLLVGPPDTPATLVVAPVPPQATSGADTLAVEDAFTDYGLFYDFLRGNKLLGPTISKSEFEGCNAIIGACVRARWGISWTAYALGTSYLETAATMQPIKEIGGNAYYTRMYDINGARPAKARELGNLTPGDGAKYPGMGYVQATGKGNAAKLTKRLRQLGFIGDDVDLVKNPELQMRPDIAAAIMVVGMEEGIFTTRKLADDLPAGQVGTLPQFVASRDIINGRDRQHDVADYAFQFQTGLLQAGYRIPA